MTRCYSFSLSCLRLPVLLLFLVIAGHYPANATLINDVDFTAVVDGATLPKDAAPAWVTGSSGGTIEVADNFLLLKTPVDIGIYFQMNGPNWDGKTSAQDSNTIEFRLRVRGDDSDYPAGDQGIFSLFIGTGGHYFIFQISETSIREANRNWTYSFDAASDFNTFRITTQGGKATLYINGGSTSLTDVSGVSQSYNYIYFGDGSSAIGGITELEYFAFTNAGAFAPNAIPEPGSFAFLGAGLGLIAMIAKRGSLLATMAAFCKQ